MKTQILTVDLHLEKIAKAYRSFAPADSLIYQVEVFERTLQANRFRKGCRIDFIHGSGTGTLRSELIKILNQKFPEFTINRVNPLGTSQNDQRSVCLMQIQLSC